MAEGEWDEREEKVREQKDRLAIRRHRNVIALGELKEVQEARLGKMDEV